jgi:hypothetical protein
VKSIYNNSRNSFFLKLKNIDILMAQCAQCNGQIKTMPIYEADGFLVCSMCGDHSMRRNKPAERLLFGNYDYFRCLICDCELNCLEKTVGHLKQLHPTEQIYRLADQPNGKLTKTNCLGDILIVLTERNVYRIDVSSAKCGIHISIIPFKGEDEPITLQYGVKGTIKMSGFLPSGSTLHLDHTGIGESYVGIACFIVSS